MGRLTRNIDGITLLLFGYIGAFGLFLLLSINQALAAQQLLFIAVAFFLCAACSLLDGDLLWWLAPLGYVVSLVLLAASYLGPAIRGATRWIAIGGFQLQPSELIKPLLILAFARAIAAFPPRNARYIPLHVALFLLPFFLVFRQPDLGTSIVYGACWLSMMLAGGLSVRALVAGMGVSLLGFPALWETLRGYQRDRILTFLNPGLDPSGAGYNAIQAMIAVGSGQLFGRGLGRGTQSHLRFLPEYHTDFIFATLIEELGFFGGILLLLGYAALLWRIIAPLLSGVVEDIFPFVYSVGLFALLLTQIFVNAGMNMGLIPVTGITLPLVSYGGSSLLSIAISFGLLWAFQRGNPQRRSIAIR